VQNASSSSSSSSSTSNAGQVVSYAADLAVANADLQLRPGMTATADIVTADKQNVLLVPNAALRFSPQAEASGQQQGGIAKQLSMGPRRGAAQRSVTLSRGATQTVYIKGDDGKPKPVQIVTGDSDGSMTEVVSGGLQPGMQVITGQLAGSSSQSTSGSGQRRRQGGTGAGGPGGGGGGA
jgi:HlyD family secretion protein